MREQKGFATWRTRLTTVTQHPVVLTATGVSALGEWESLAAVALIALCWKGMHLNLQIRSLATDARGQWLASGSDDGHVRVWEVRSGRSMRAWNLGAKVRCVAWCPGLPILAAAAGNRVVLLPAGAYYSSLVGHRLEFRACAVSACNTALDEA